MKATLKDRCGDWRDAPSLDDYGGLDIDGGQQASILDDPAAHGHAHGNLGVWLNKAVGIEQSLDRTAEDCFKLSGERDLERIRRGPQPLGVRGELERAAPNHSDRLEDAIPDLEAPVGYA